MKRILLIFLTLLISVSIIGCSLNMNEEQYENFESEIQLQIKDMISYIETNLIVSQEESHIHEMIDYIKSVGTAIEKTIQKSEARIPDDKKEIFESNYSLSIIEENISKLGISLEHIDKPSRKREVRKILDNWKQLTDYDEELDNTWLDKLSTEEKFEIKVKEYMKENKVSLSWKDIQYDMPNNLDKKFMVAGIAELSDYYNYGFRGREDDYFSISVTPYDGKYTNRWYLYLNRESFQELFNSLKEGERVIIATCEIPEFVYKEGQGNMAFVSQARW